MMEGVLSLLCSCRRNNFNPSKQLIKLNKDNELKTIIFIENKIPNSSSQINWKRVWKFHETQNALLDSPFFVIPTEIIFKIFGLLSFNDLRNISLVCRYFKMIIGQDTIWKTGSFERLKRFEEKYLYMKIPSCFKYSSSINNELLFSTPRHPNSSANMIIQLSVDIDKTVHELMSLLEKASEFETEWHKSVILKQMIKRYYRFLKLKIFYPKLFLVPTIDIEITWQTHLLRPLIYRNDCLRLFNQIIDHSLLLNDIQQSFKQQAFLHTYYLYEKHFHEQYCSLLLYKNTKTSLSRYLHPYFNKSQCLNSMYSYWDETLFQFSEYSSDDFQNPFSFTEFDIISDANWIYSCKYFMNNISFEIPEDIWRFNLLKPINLKASNIKRLKKSYERFLYMATIYPPMKESNFIHPTYSIDIIWHCHMQEPFNYANDCNRLVGYFIDHYPSPSIEKKLKKQLYKDLKRFWKKEYQHDITTDHLRNS